MAGIADIVRQRGQDRADVPAIVSRLGSITYGELDARSSRVAQGLRAAGVAQGHNVAFLDKNTPEYFEVVFGACKIGAVACAVNWRLAPPEAAFVINDSEATVLLVGEELCPVWHAIAPDVPGIRQVIVIGKDGAGETYEEWIARYDPVDPAVEVAPEDVGLQFYSSGTTGRPKGVMITHANMEASVSATNQMLGFAGSSVNLVAMPLFHVAGGAWGLFGLHNGVTNVLMRDVDPAEVVRVIAEHGITHAVLVPAVIQFILGLPGLQRSDFATLEMLVYGASPISEDVLVRAIELFDCRFLQAYGMTETTGGCVLLAPEDHDPGGPNRHRLRAAGRPGPGTEVRVVDPEDLSERPVGEVGEIIVRTPLNMKGYWKLPDETAATLLPDNWLRTGDAGFFDEDGYVYIHDRVKDMIISGGENIYPAEVENVLMAHPAIADAALIGVPHDRWGETPKAILVAAPGQTIDAEDVIAFCRSQLAHYKCPTSVEIVAELPRNPSGKILKRELREPYWEGRARRVQ